MKTLHIRMRKMGFLKGISVLVLVFSIFFGTKAQAQAQSKSFVYDRMDFTYDVKDDSTTDVSEVLTYSFTGQYNTATRNLVLNKVDSIDNIQVFEIDPVTQQERPLEYKVVDQDKLNSNSWGTYNIKNEGSQKIIQWYFNVYNSQKIYRINYTLHGAISFLNDKQELYWNLFTDFEAPISSIQAIVYLPKKVSGDSITSSLYYSGPHEEDDAKVQMFDTVSDPTDFRNYVTYIFSLKNISANEMVTIAAGWPKDLISQHAYFTDAAKHYYPILVTIFSILFTIIYLSVFWYRREIAGSKGVVIPQYEPPRGLTPVVMSMILLEDIPVKALTATIIDLAVRGFISITEDAKESFLEAKIPEWIKKLMPQEYILTLLKPIDSKGLSAFEKRYLEALKLDEKPFSTRDYKLQRNTYLATQLPIVKNAAYKDTAGIEDVFVTSLKTEKMKGNKVFAVSIVPAALIVFAVINLATRDLLPSFLRGITLMHFIMFATIYVCFVFYVRFTKYEAYLSEVGRKLYDEIKGFELFLGVTGKDRMQKLTPDMFEKYLPYAVLFEIEKDWANNFEGMHLQSPVWYHGYVYGVGAHSGFNSGSVSMSSFSASAFSSSLSSSFASAMSSSGASGGGGSGGGGGAGGGGGGGGGGAS